MKALRAFAILSLGFCLWILLFPPWVDSENWLIWNPDSSSVHRLGHHWRFSAPPRWQWSEQIRKSVPEPVWTARIDYRLLAYEIAIAVAALGLLVLLLQASSGMIRKLLVNIKIETLLLRTRLKNPRILVKPRIKVQSRAFIFTLAVVLLGIVGLTLKSPHSQGDVSNFKWEASSSPAAMPWEEAAKSAPVPSRSRFSLPNGTELRKRLHLNGHGDLSVQNGKSRDAVVHLVDLNTQRTVRTFYVRAGMSFTETQISPGLYGIYFSTGADWSAQGRCFSEDVQYSQFGRNLQYSETHNEEAGKVEYSHYEITLQPVRGGDVALIPSNKDSFDRMMRDNESE